MPKERFLVLHRLRGGAVCDMMKVTDNNIPPTGLARLARGRSSHLHCIARNGQPGSDGRGIALIAALFNQSVNILNGFIDQEIDAFPFPEIQLDESPDSKARDYTFTDRKVSVGGIQDGNKAI